MRGVASLSWADAGQPLVALGDAGTGKTHILISVGLAAAQAGERVRYTTVAALVTELAGRRACADAGGGPFRAPGPALLG